MSWWENAPLAPQQPAQPLGPLGTQRIGTTGEGRAVILNPDGSHSSERSITIGIDGRYVNIPSMFGGREVSEGEAVEIMRRNGWRDPETGRPAEFYPTLDAALGAARSRSQSIPAGKAEGEGAVPDSRSGQLPPLPPGFQLAPQSASPSGPWDRYKNDPVVSPQPATSAGPWTQYQRQDADKAQSGNWWEAAPLAEGAPQMAGAAGAAGAASAAPGNAPTDDSEGLMGDVNAVVNRLGTQFTKGMTGLIGLPDTMLSGLQGIGDWTTRQLMSEDQYARVQAKQREREAAHAGKPTLSDYLFPHWKALPSTAGINDAIFNGLGVPEVSGQTPAGKILDVGLQALPAGVLAGPQVAFPSFTGGIASETAGQVADAAGAPGWVSVLARLGGGVMGGVTGAAMQDAAGTVGRGLRNAIGAGDADDVAARIAGRAMTRDNTDPQRIAQALREAGPDATIADVGGQNVRAAVRGSTVRPGPAREIADDFFSSRRAAEGERVAAAIDANVSGQRGFTSTIDDIVAERARKASPLYEAAGIPRDPAHYAQAPLLAGQEVKDLIAKSGDIRRAIAQAKGMPQYAGLKDNSIVLLDKAYKNLGGKAEAARRSGDMALYRDLAEQRDMLKAAIVAERPEYGAALKAFADDSALKDAIESGRKLFRGATDPEAIAKHYDRLSPDERELFRQGVAEHLRSIAERTSIGSEARRVYGGPAMQAKLQSVLGDDYPAFAQAMEREMTFNRTMRDVTGGSRTTPMANEAADLDQQTSLLGDLFSGRFLRAGQTMAGAAIDRVATGRREAVNAQLARMLLDPNAVSQAQAIAAINRQIQGQMLADMLRRNSYVRGAAIPATIGATQGAQ